MGRVECEIRNTAAKMADLGPSKCKKCCHLSNLKYVPVYDFSIWFKFKMWITKQFHFEVFQQSKTNPTWMFVFFRWILLSLEGAHKCIMMLPKVPLRLAFLIDVDFRFNKVHLNATWQLCSLTLTDTNGIYKKNKNKMKSFKKWLFWYIFCQQWRQTVKSSKSRLKHTLTHWQTNSNPNITTHKNRN